MQIISWRPRRSIMPTQGQRLGLKGLTVSDYYALQAYCFLPFSASLSIIDGSYYYLTVTELSLL